MKKMSAEGSNTVLSDVWDISLRWWRCCIKMVEMLYKWTPELKDLC